MHILFDRNTLEVIATIGAETDIVKDPYELLDLGDKEPTFENKDGKIVFNGLRIIGEQIMGNITQLHQGSLNGLRRQVNECLDSAYNKGYEDGAKNQDEVQYQKGYEKGYEDGKKCISERISENKLNEAKADGYNNGYNSGYNTAINDYNMMIQWLWTYTEGYKKFLVDRGFYDAYGNVPKSAENILVELTNDFDMAEVISEFKKWHDDKADIKVGDIVKFNEKCHNYDHVKSREFLVLHIFDNGLVTLLYDNGDTGASEISRLDKTGRHIDETSQLLDKLRGE